MEQTLGKQTKTKAQGDPPLDDAGAVVVVGVDAGKKKKGSSSGSRRLADVESRVSKSIHRVTKAVNKGVGTYLDERDKSARKRRDDALLDFCENVSKGFSDAVADSSPVFTDIANSI